MARGAIASVPLLELPGSKVPELVEGPCELEEDSPKRKKLELE